MVYVSEYSPFFNLLKQETSVANPAPCLADSDPGRGSSPEKIGAGSG